jgi:hypothetical protein
VLLMSATQDPAYQHAATRWLVRLASERPTIGLQDLRIALDALQALAASQPAHTTLAELCARHHVGVPTTSLRGTTLSVSPDRAVAA